MVLTTKLVAEFYASGVIGPLPGDAVPRSRRTR
jgi:hypothetical protein